MVVMVLDLMHVNNFCGQTVAGVKNVVIFGADMDSFVNVYDKKRYLSSWERSNKRIR